jgi:SAM-dependent methyltransferase
MTSSLSPHPAHANYLHRRALATQIRAAVRGLPAGQRVVDVGCGDRPYEPILRPIAAEYVGVDATAGPAVDVVANADALPFDDERFDLLLCSQVLEHVEDPAACVAEAWRVTAAGGTVLLSTHGVVNYHPNPEDYWRWTHAGLAYLFARNGAWQRVDVIPNGGTATAIAYLAGRQLEVLAERAHALAALRPAIFGLNVAAWRMDRAYRRAFPDRPPDLSPNFLVVARRAAAS